MTPRVITPAEMAPGQHVTVLDVIEDEKNFDKGNVLVVEQAGQRQDWRGIAFEVLAVDLPFVLMLLPNASARVSLDSRKFQFMELKEEFWKAIVAPTTPIFEQQVSHALQRLSADIEIVTVAHNNLVPRVAAIEQRMTAPPPRPWWKRIFSHAKAPDTIAKV